MDKEKEGVLGTITDAAKTSMDPAIEGVSSAATRIAEAATGTTKSPKGGEGVRPPRKLPPAEAGLRSGGQRRSPRLAGPHARLLVSVLDEALKRSEAPRSLGPPKVVDVQPSAADEQIEQMAEEATGPRPAC
jgi:hypothetical protein